jgi:hypothetical protein
VRRAALALVLLILSSACAGEGGSPAPRSPGLVVSVAGFDMAADFPARFLVGLGTEDGLYVSGGSVDLRFFFLGEQKAEGSPKAAGEATATFLPLPGEEIGAAPPNPVAAPASRGRGVYEVDEFRFDRPGLWEVEATAVFGGGDRRTGRGAFEVLPEPLVPIPGEVAPRTENLTTSSKGAPPGAIDSRAAAGGPIPDPELHRVTIAEAIEAGHPALVVFATPVYCVSKFCGPVTDMVAGLAAEYSDRADFIHVEIWRDFQNQVVNAAAAEWLLRHGDLQEPWVFLIGADGRIAARWDNVADKEEIESLLDRLPAIDG